jgi:hypothetical protein
VDQAAAPADIAGIAGLREQLHGLRWFASLHALQSLRIGGTAWCPCRITPLVGGADGLLLANADSRCFSDPATCGSGLRGRLTGQTEGGQG